MKRKEAIKRSKKFNWLSLDADIVIEKGKFYLCWTHNCPPEYHRYIKNATNTVIPQFYQVRITRKQVKQLYKMASLIFEA